MLIGPIITTVHIFYSELNQTVELKILTGDS